MFATRNRKTFTLIELIVVIVILGLLASIAVVGYVAIVNNTKRTSLESTTGFFTNEASALAAFETGETPSNWAVHFAVVVNANDMPANTIVRAQAGDGDEIILSDYGPTPGQVLTVSATDPDTLADDAVAVSFERDGTWACVTFDSVVSASSNSQNSTYTVESGFGASRDLTDGECTLD